MTLQSFCLAAGLALLSATSAAADKGHSTRNSVDWDGRYAGELPCASCPGIDTVLTINEAGHYTLKETYREEKEGTFSSRGKFTWNKAGDTITLKGRDASRVFRIGEGQAWMVGADGKTDDKHPLTKLVEFNGGGQQLYAHPASLKAQDGKVAFTGLINFQHQAEGGHKSLQGDFLIDCKKKEAAMPRVAYYKKTDAQGKKLHEAKDNAGSSAPIPKDEDDVMAQMAAAYCD